MPIAVNGKPRPTQEPEPLRLVAGGPAALAVQSALRNGLERMTRCQQPARQGLVEGVHGMRTSTRRIRSALRTFGDLVNDEWAVPLEDELRWLAGVLGAVRDLDVLRERLLRAAGHSQTTLAPLFRLLAEEHERASATLRSVLHGDRYKRLIERLEQAALQPPLRADLKEISRSDLPELALGSWKSLKKRGRALEPDDPDEAFHDVRKRAKRARYVAEDLVPLLGTHRAEEAKRYAKAATRVQDLLGEHQDAVVAAQTITRIAAAYDRDIPFQRAADRLLKHQQRAADRSRKRFFKVWDKLDRKKVRRWLKP